ncbi:hypothetical protein CASFOL_040049 [Castilleja foliolosa]|uniref:Uncharacterized protein n=1 Tax=Castilleja foliolosa TaxID=1961234 RepID=A0ABD3BED2_9LAMI
MDMEKLMQKHPNVSRGQLEKMRETSSFLNISEICFPRIVESLDRKIEN